MAVLEENRPFRGNYCSNAGIARLSVFRRIQPDEVVTKVNLRPVVTKTVIFVVTNNGGYFSHFDIHSFILIPI